MWPRHLNPATEATDFGQSWQQSPGFKHRMAFSRYYLHMQLLSFGSAELQQALASHMAAVETAFDGQMQSSHAQIQSLLAQK